MGTFNGNSGGAATLKSWTDSDFNFTFSSVSTPRITSQGGSSIVTISDHTVTRTTGTSYNNDQQINVSVYIPSPFATQLVFSSSNTGVATVDQSGKVSQVSDGAVTIQIGTNLLSRGAAFNLVAVTGATVDTFLAYSSGTLGLNASTAVDSRIAGLTASNTTKNLWSTRDDSTPIYVWNTQFWGYGVDLTCVSPWNSSGANTKAGTLISPRHIQMAKHFPVPNASTIRFVKQDGTVVVRTVMAQATVGTTDISIAILDSDVPAGISFCPILPANGASAYLPTLAGSVTVPVLALNQSKRGIVLDWIAAGDTAIFQFPVNAQRLTFAESVITGDSGSPVFAIINGVLVLLTCWDFGGNGGSGPWPSNFISSVNAVMHSLSVGQGAASDYQLTTVDLSGFTSF